MRWDNLTIAADEGARLPGYRDPATVRRFDAPEALDMRFYEVHAKSALNRVPAASQMPFRWTINPYRGCSHACLYCFARPTHTYLDFDAGRDFEREIVVKVNAPELVRAELGRPSWKGEHVAMGTNTDPYQWVESRYKLMPGIWEAMRDARNPCSILTKSPLLLRDIELMKQIAAVTDIHANLSIPTLDPMACIRTQNLPVLDVLDVLRWDVADALSGLVSTPKSLDRCSSSYRSREGNIPTCRAHSPGTRLEPKRAEVRPSERLPGLRRAIRHGL